MSWTYKNREYPSCNSRDEVIDHILELFMADLSALNTAVDNAVAGLADLAAKVAAGDTTAQSDIDAITAKLVAAVNASDPSVPAAASAAVPA